MPIDEELLAEAVRAAERIAQAQHAVLDARAGFQRAVRALYVDGGSMREIAERLGISHQRVHQLLDLPKPDDSRWRQHRVRARRGPALPDCQFCGRSQQQVRKLIMGSGTAVCNACATLGHALLHGGALAVQRNAHVTLAVRAGPGSCGFCGKETGTPDPHLGSRALALVVAPNAAGAICAECLDVAVEIITEELGAP
jgi:hypothetical protein